MSKLFRPIIILPTTDPKILTQFTDTYNKNNKEAVIIGNSAEIWQEDLETGRWIKLRDNDEEIQVLGSVL